MYTQILPVRSPALEPSPEMRKNCSPNCSKQRLTNKSH